MGFQIEAGIQEGKETFDLKIETVRRWVPVAAYRDGVEVHGWTKLKYVLFYGTGVLLISFLLAIPLLLLGLLLWVVGLMVALAGVLAALLEAVERRFRRAEDDPRPSPLAGARDETDR